MRIFSILLIAGLSAGALGFSRVNKPADDLFLTYTVDPAVQDIAFYWKNDRGKILSNFGNLKTHVKKQGKRLLFAANGGMFNAGHAPQGLYIENFRTLAPLDTAGGNGNFYLKPNGVFYLDDTRRAVVCTTENFQKNTTRIRFATQSGPMLLIDGRIHPAFRPGSSNLNIRNGAGVLPDGKVVFVLSKTAVNLYDFASYFQSLGCQNALYLDGFVSRAWLPEQNWLQTDGNFGVMIGVTQPQ